MSAKKFVLKGLSLGLMFATQLQAQPYNNSCDYQNCNPCAVEECINQFWVEADYLYWKFKDSPEPVPLVISGPIAPILPVLNGPGTAVILGGKSISTDWRSGGKVALGYWFDNACGNGTYGVEANYMYFPSESKKHSINSDDFPTEFLSTPFFNVITGVEDSTGIAIPGSFTGIAHLRVSNKMQGAELNGLAKYPCNCDFNIGWLAGFRYWNFNEELTFATSSPFISTPDVFETKDKFDVTNNFYGGQIGAGFEYLCNNFIICAKAKVALGAMCEEVDIKGQLITNDFNGFGTPIAYLGGYFAQPTNIGRHKHTQFSVIPEADIDLGYKVTNDLQLKVGYSFLYVSKLLRAGNQIDRNINPTQSVAMNDSSAVLVGDARPKALLKSSNFWAQGLKVGVEYSF